MLAHVYNIIIDRGVEAPGHGQKVVYGLNFTEKLLLLMLMKTVKLPGEAAYDSQPRSV